MTNLALRKAHHRPQPSWPDLIRPSINRHNNAPSHGDHEATSRAYPCSACNSLRIASPICDVLTTLMPSDVMSDVRRPLANTAAIA